jgi:uracil-DNA glycosylase
MRPVILGEAPSKSGDRYWQFPLSGAVGQRLCEWAGLEPEAGGSRYGRYYWPLNEAFELRNLLERYPGPQGRGAALPMGLARSAWEELEPALAGRVLVVLGSRLREVVGIDPTFYEWNLIDRKDPGCPRGFVRACAIPHPSGLNRAYNAEEARARASATLREALDMTSIVL